MLFDVYFDNGLPVKDFIGIKKYYLDETEDGLMISFKVSSQVEEEKKLIGDIKEQKDFKIHIFDSTALLSVWLCIADNYYVVIKDIERKYIDYFTKGMVKLNIMVNDDLSVIIEID